MKFVLCLLLVFVGFQSHAYTVPNNHVVIQGSSFTLTAGELRVFLNGYFPAPVEIVSVTTLRRFLDLNTYNRNISFKLTHQNITHTVYCRLNTIPREDLIEVVNCSARPAAEVLDLRGVLSKATFVRKLR